MTTGIPALNACTFKSDTPARLATLRGSVNGVIDAWAPWQPGRRTVETFIRARFFEHYGARPHISMPELITLKDEIDTLQAAVGLRPADGGKLFLEHYLDKPIETHVSAIAGCPISRNEIVEVGHLAGSSHGLSRCLFVVLTALLAERGVCWIAFTGTRQVQNTFNRLHIQTGTITRADPTRIPGGGRGWGTYYDADPQVMVGDVALGFATLRDAGVFQSMGLEMTGEVADVVGH